MSPKPRGRKPTPKREEILRLGSLHNPKTKKPTYTHEQIAKKTGVTAPTVFKTLKRSGIERTEQRGRKPTTKTEEIINLGSLHVIKTKKPTYTYKQIAKKTGVTASTAFKNLKRLSIKRTDSRAMTAQKREEIINLGSLHNPETKKPTYTLQQIGQRFGFTRERVRQILAEASIERTTRRKTKK